MKKILLALALCAGVLTGVNAQTAKGNLFLGTGLGATSYNTGNYTFDYSDGNNVSQNDKKYALSLSPSIGVFLTDHLVFGGSLDVSYDHEKSVLNNTDPTQVGSISTTNSTNYSVGPFLRYYFFNTTPSSTLFYLQGNAGIGSGSQNSTQNSTNTSTSNVYTAHAGSLLLFNAAGSLGITHFVSKTIGLDLAVSYLYNYEKYTDNFSNVTTNSAGVPNSNSGTFKATLPQNGIGLSAGFHLFLGK
jgi:hypothetical protein